MILTLTPNPATDITYAVPRLHVGETHRVSITGTHAGGKGLNVAGVLASMGIDTISIAPVGEQQREFFVADTAQRGIRLSVVDSSVATRRSVAIYGADGQATVLNEQGLPLNSATWAAMAAAVSRRCRAGDVLAIAGSLPPASPDDVLVDLCRSAAEAGATVVLDGRGNWVTEVLSVVPAIVKPNAAEARFMTGCSDPTDAAHALVQAGAPAALVSRGAEGLVLVTESGRILTAAPSAAGVGNATGAGDALTAAVCQGLDGQSVDAVDWEDVLRTGVAWAGAAVRQNLAGVIDRADVEALIDDVVLLQRA